MVESTHQTLVLEDSDQKYVGEVKDGQPHGYGKLFDEDGLKVYEGTFKEGQKVGKGIEFDDEGNITFEGSFDDDQPMGEGTLYYSDGSKYKGEVQGNSKNGFGKLWD